MFLQLVHRDAGTIRQESCSARSCTANNARLHNRGYYRGMVRERPIIPPHHTTPSATSPHPSPCQANFYYGTGRKVCRFTLIETSLSWLKSRVKHRRNNDALTVNSVFQSSTISILTIYMEESQAVSVPELPRTPPLPSRRSRTRQACVGDAFSLSGSD